MSVKKRQIGNDITIKLTTEVLTDKWDVEIRMKGSISNGTLMTSFARTEDINIFRNAENPELLIELAMRSLWGNVTRMLREKLINFGVYPEIIEQLPEVEEMAKYLQKKTMNSTEVN